MNSRTAKAVLAAILTTVSSTAMAQSGGWRVSESAGAVSIRHGDTLLQAKRDMAIAPGDAILTGPTGRAVLVHDKDFVTVSANSRMRVPLDQASGGFVKMIQDLGNAIFKIEKQGVPHFGVNTPYLAAVVKGTTFSVTVDAAGTSLQVVEGAVEVATVDGGARDLIRPGGVATIAASDLYRLSVSGDESRTIDSPSRPAAGAAPAAAAGSGTVAAAPPVVAVSAPTPVAPINDSPAASVEFSAPQAAVITSAIMAKPVDLGAFTGGLVSGTSGVAAVVAAVSAPVLAATPATPAAPPSPPPVAVTSPAPPPAAAETPPATTPAPAEASPPATPPVAIPSPPAAAEPPAALPPVVTPPAALPPAAEPPAAEPPAAEPPAADSGDRATCGRASRDATACDRASCYCTTCG